MERFIRNNINNLNKYLVKGFLDSKDIAISLEQAEIVTNLLKKNWEDLYHKNYNNTFYELKQVLSRENYDKLLNLYLSFVK